MRRISLVLAAVFVLSVMVATAAPAMANDHWRGDWDKKDWRWDKDRDHDWWDKDRDKDRDHHKKWRGHHWNPWWGAHWNWWDNDWDCGWVWFGWPWWGFYWVCGWD